jgi:ABC-type transporter Mla subunit MlaD
LSKEARLGMLASFVIVLVGYLISMATSASQQKNWGTAYHIIFSRVEGIDEGSKVYYNGRFVGRVRDLKLQTSERPPYVGERADVTIALNPNPLVSSSVVFTRESTCKINGGLWGAKWIEIQYEPGELVPPGGSMMGETVPSFNHQLYHGVQNLEALHDMVSYYKKQLGSGDAARKKIKAMIRYWNYMAFDLRVQANRFNQFSGLIQQRLDTMVGKVDDKIIAARARGKMMIAQMQLAAHAMVNSALAQDASARAMVARLMAQMEAMKTAVSGLGVYIAAGDTLVNGLLATARKRVQQAEDMVAALRFISKNPKFADQFRVLSQNMRQKAAQMRETIDALRKRTAPRGAAPSPGPELPAGTDESLPPLGPGVPMPPERAPSPAPGVPGPLPTTVTPSPGG